MKRITTTIRYVYFIDDDVDDTKDLEKNKIEWAHEIWPHPAVNEQVEVISHKIEEV